MNLLFSKIQGPQRDTLAALKGLLTKMDHPFHKGDSVGIKLHWGERGNHSYLPPEYTREIVRWLQKKGVTPFIFDTTVLYSGGRRSGKDSLATATGHGFTEEYLGCEVVIADGLEGDDVVGDEAF